MLGNRIFLTDTLKDNIPNLIEVFVSFYGEEHRERIEKKFNDLVIMGYANYTSYAKFNQSDNSEDAVRVVTNPIKTAIDMEISKICNEAVKEFSKETGIKDEKKLQLLFGYYYNFTSPDIGYLVGEPQDFYRERLIVKLVNDYYGTEFKEFDDEEFKDYYEEIKKLVPAYLKANDVYNREYDSRVKKYEDYYEKLKILSSSILEKYEYDFLKEIYEYLPSFDKNVVDENTLSTYRYYLKSSNVLMGGEYFYSNSLIEAFSKNSNEQLADEEVDEYIKESILTDRIFYFNSFGFELGDNYEDYINNEEVMKIFPSEEMVQKIVDAKKKYGLGYRKELFLSLPHHQKALDEINSIDFLEDPDPFMDTGNEKTCIEVTFEKKDGKLIPRPILYMSIDLFNDSFDCNLCHELNHLYELEYLGTKGNINYSLCGWDYIVDEVALPNSVEDYYQTEPKRDYELVNEIINEFIAQDLCAMMHNRGIYVISEKGEASNTGHTGYEASIGKFARRFYREFKEDIIKSRIDNNIGHLYDVIGQDNFEEYSKMLLEFYIRFPGDAGGNLAKQAYRGVDNKNTRYFNECCQKRDELLEKMKEHKEEYYRSTHK